MREPAPGKLGRPATAAQKANAERGQHATVPNAQAPNRTNVSVPSVAQQPRPADRSRRTVGLAPGNAERQLSPADRQRLEAARRVPILRNPAFAGTLGARATGPRETFRGRFAESGFARDLHRRHDHRLGFVLGFVGPVFWPYAYSDFVDYTFSPYAYDTFWPYAFDDVYSGIFGGYAPEYYATDDVYAYAGAAASERAYARFAGAAPPARTASATQSRICSGEAQGITDFSIDKIAQQIQADQKQQALLDQLKDATVKAVNIMQNACPSDLPSTPTGRFDAMLTRVNAMLQAVRTIRPALDAFYQSLSDEQRERFNVLDQGTATDRAQRSDLARLCDSHAASANPLPTAQIERSLKLSPEQQSALGALDQASVKAAENLKTSCQADQTLTPTGRLAAMEDRLSAMSQALTTTQAALNRFYGSLNDEQKARFNRMPLRAT